MTITVHANQFGQVFVQNEQLRVARMNRAIYAAALIGVRILRSVVPIDRGELRRETKVEMDGNTPVIVEDTPYAAAQEYGTAPFMPPLEPLVEWAKRQAPNLGIDEKDAYALAVGVQHAISISGIRAKWHTRDSIPRLREVLEEQLRLAARVA